MKKVFSFLLMPLLAGAVASCDDFSFLSDSRNGAPGELRWHLDASSLPTKAAEEIPDTNDFLLSIRDGGGKTLYEGAYGDAPTSLQVDAGSYTVSVVSVAFTSPAFSRPQYGDEQVVIVSGGQSVTVPLHCTLQNAGVRLHINPNFLDNCPDGVLYLKQDDVKLKYQYAEQRIAYFLPGEVSLLLYENGAYNSLYTRRLNAREILDLQISAPAPNGSGSSQFSVQVDTAKTWLTDQYEIGGKPGGGSPAPGGDAISVGAASGHIGETVWLYGYIVGGDLSSAGKSVKTDGITKATHLALADRSSVTEKAACVAVELPQGAVREALNLVDHPDLIGCRVYVKGQLVESYFGTTGLKGTNDFSLK